MNVVMGVTTTLAWWAVMLALSLLNPWWITVGCGIIAYAVYLAARRMGIEAWTAWEPGDATDLCCMVYTGLLLLMWR